MNRRWVGAVAGCAVLAAGIGLAARAGSGPTLSVAYVTGSSTSDSQVWLAPMNGGSGRRLGPGSRPLLAPDGTLVAVSISTGLAVYSATGGQTHRYFENRIATATAAAFSADSRYLAVVLISTNPASSSASGLAVIDTVTFASRVLAHGQIYGASFAPDRSDRIAFASAGSAALAAPVDISLIGPSGSGSHRITRDGRSLNPVWGRVGIAFDHERLRTDAEPASQVWLMASDGSRRRQLTALSIPRLREGLVPTAFSASGGVLLARYEGQNLDQAWIVSVPSGSATALGPALRAAALSRDGSSALVDRGGFLNPPDHGVIESLPLRPGRPTGRARIIAVRGSEPSWNV